MSLSKHSFIYAVAAVFAVIVYSLLIYLGGIRIDALQYFSYAIFTGIAIYAIKSWRDKENNGIISFGGVMKYGSLMALFYSLLIAVWTFFFMKYIAPELVGEMLLKQQAAMEAKGLQPKQIEMGIKMSKMIMQPPVMAVLALIGNMFFITIINLIISAVMKKDPPVTFENPGTANLPNNPYVN
ncbi:MAG: DUF4199 domain-containing protein [Bacteroidia bacterium]